jgi:uncharacterized protein (UPF0297 family)
MIKSDKIIIIKELIENGNLKKDIELNANDVKKDSIKKVKNSIKEKIEEKLDLLYLFIGYELIKDNVNIQHLNFDNDTNEKIKNIDLDELIGLLRLYESYENGKSIEFLK